MKITKTFEDAISRQMNLEWTAAYTYMAMCGWFETTPFKGFARFMQRQAVEERQHAMRLFDYLRDRIGDIELYDVAKPKNDYKSPISAFEAALAMERESTKALHELYQLSLTHADYETQELLHAFLKGHIEEEKVLSDFIDKMEIAGNKPAAILHLDAHLTEHYA